MPEPGLKRHSGRRQPGSACSLRESPMLTASNPLEGLRGSGILNAVVIAHQVQP